MHEVCRVESVGCKLGVNLFHGFSAAVRYDKERKCPSCRLALAFAGFGFGARIFQCFHSEKAGVRNKRRFLAPADAMLPQIEIAFEDGGKIGGKFRHSLAGGVRPVRCSDEFDCHRFWFWFWFSVSFGVRFPGIESIRRL